MTEVDKSGIEELDNSCHQIGRFFVHETPSRVQVKVIVWIICKDGGLKLNAPQVEKEVLSTTGFRLKNLLVSSGNL